MNAHIDGVTRRRPRGPPRRPRLVRRVLSRVVAPDRHARPCRATSLVPRPARSARCTSIGGSGTTGSWSPGQMFVALVGSPDGVADRARHLDDAIVRGDAARLVHPARRRPRVPRGDRPHPRDTWWTGTSTARTSGGSPGTTRSSGSTGPPPIPSCPSGIGTIPGLAEALRDPIPYRPDRGLTSRRRRA